MGFVERAMSGDGYREERARLAQEPGFGKGSTNRQEDAVWKSRLIWRASANGAAPYYQREGAAPQERCCLDGRNIRTRRKELEGSEDSCNEPKS